MHPGLRTGDGAFVRRAGRFPGDPTARPPRLEVGYRPHSVTVEYFFTIWIYKALNNSSPVIDCQCMRAAPMARGLNNYPTYSLSGLLITIHFVIAPKVFLSIRVLRFLDSCLKGLSKGDISVRCSR